MSELRLEPLRERPYGFFARGVAEHNGHEVAVRIRSPHANLEDVDLPKVINLNGLTADHESMAVPARMCATLGYMAITLDYTNKGFAKPLDRNAEDGLTVLECIPDGPLTIVGLSMGGDVGTIVTDKADRSIETLYAVSPGGYTKVLGQFTLQKLTGAVAGEARDDLSQAMRHPYRELSVGMGCVRNCVHRPLAVISEANTLTHSTVYPELRNIRATRPETKVVLAYASHDHLVPKEPLLASITDEEGSAPGSLIDILAPYDGIHTRLVRDPALTEYVIGLGAAVDLSPAA